MLTSKIPLEQIGNEHECMDCGGTCFCQAGASDKFSCVHACEMDEYEDYEDALNEADLMVDPFRFGENF